jgi:hypothetical protein
MGTFENFKANLLAGLIVIVMVALGFLMIINPPGADDDDWYLVCSGRDKDYLVKSEGRPYTKDGFIYVDKESFITAEAGMTCKPVKGEVVRAAIGQKDA